MQTIFSLGCRSGFLSSDRRASGDITHVLGSTISGDADSLLQLFADPEVIIDKRLRVNSLMPKWGKPPLHIAAAANNLKLVRTLLTYGAIPDLVDTSGCTALLLASKYGFTDIVHAILEAGADVHMSQVDKGRELKGTACLHNTILLYYLHHLCHPYSDHCERYRRIYKLLLQYGSNCLHGVDARGRSVEDYVNEVNDKISRAASTSSKSLPKPVPSLKCLAAMAVTWNKLLYTGLNKDVMRCINRHRTYCSSHMPAVAPTMSRHYEEFEGDQQHQLAEPMAQLWTKDAHKTENRFKLQVKSTEEYSQTGDIRPILERMYADIMSELGDIKKALHKPKTATTSNRFSSKKLKYINSNTYYKDELVDTASKGHHTGNKRGPVVIRSMPEEEQLKAIKTLIRHDRISLLPDEDSEEIDDEGIRNKENKTDNYSELFQNKDILETKAEIIDETVEATSGSHKHDESSEDKSSNTKSLQPMKSLADVFSTLISSCSITIQHVLVEPNDDFLYFTYPDNKIFEQDGMVEARVRVINTHSSFGCMYKITCTRALNRYKAKPPIGFIMPQDQRDVIIRGIRSEIFQTYSDEEPKNNLKIKTKKDSIVILCVLIEERVLSGSVKMMWKGVASEKMMKIRYKPIIEKHADLSLSAILRRGSIFSNMSMPGSRRASRESEMSLRNHYPGHSSTDKKKKKKGLFDIMPAPSTSGIKTPKIVFENYLYKDSNKLDVNVDEDGTVGLTSTYSHQVYEEESDFNLGKPLSAVCEDKSKEMETGELLDNENISETQNSVIRVTDIKERKATKGREKKIRNSEKQKAPPELMSGKQQRTKKARKTSKDSKRKKEKRKSKRHRESINSLELAAFGSDIRSKKRNRGEKDVRLSLDPNLFLEKFVIESKSKSVHGLENKW